MLVSTDWVVKPTVPATHARYTFYVKVSASGGSSAFFTQYILDVGCTSTSVTLTDGAGLSLTGVAKLVGDPVTSVYTFT